MTDYSYVSVNAYEIPLLSQPQTFQVTLATVLYQFAINWCDPMGAWTLDIFDSAGNPLVRGQAMTTGLDLLGQYKYLKFGGELVILSDGPDPLVPPTFDNLGTGSHLYFVPS